MPACGERLAAEEIWRSVAYVETLAEQGQEGEAGQGDSTGGSTGQGGDG